MCCVRLIPPIPSKSNVPWAPEAWQIARELSGQFYNITRNRCLRTSSPSFSIIFFSSNLFLRSFCPAHIFFNFLSFTFLYFSFFLNISWWQYLACWWELAECIQWWGVYLQCPNTWKSLYKDSQASYSVVTFDYLPEAVPEVSLWSSHPLLTLIL